LHIGQWHCLESHVLQNAFSSSGLDDFALVTEVGLARASPKHGAAAQGCSEGGAVEHDVYGLVTQLLVEHDFLYLFGEVDGLHLTEHVVAHLTLLLKFVIVHSEGHFVHRLQLLVVSGHLLFLRQLELALGLFFFSFLLLNEFGLPFSILEVVGILRFALEINLTLICYGFLDFREVVPV